MDQFEAWGWRMPVLLSALVVAVGIVIRLKRDESPACAITGFAPLVATALSASAGGAWWPVAGRFQRSPAAEPIRRSGGSCENPSVELRRLRLLLELSRRGTIGDVAEALSYSPSSVSVQLAELEREVGVKLLRRVGRNVQLTPAGWRLVEHAEQALAVDEAIVTELASVDGRPRGRVRVTFVQTPALALLPSALAALAESAPDLRVEVSQRETAPALEELRARAVDVVLGIDYDPVPVPRHRDVHRVDLIREQVLLAVPADDPLARAGAPIPLAGVEHAVWAAGHVGTGHAAAIEHLCNGVGGYAPDIRHRTDDALILRALVSSGQAVTLLPALIGTATPQVTVLPIAEGEVLRTIFTAARATAADLPAVVAVRDALRAAARAAVAGRDDARLQ